MFCLVSFMIFVGFSIIFAMGCMIHSLNKDLEKLMKDNNKEND